MQSGDWRLQAVGRPDELPLILAVYFLVAMVVIGIMLKVGLLQVDNRRRR